MRSAASTPRQRQDRQDEAPAASPKGKAKAKPKAAVGSRIAAKATARPSPKKADGPVPPSPRDDGGDGSRSSRGGSGAPRKAPTDTGRGVRQATQRSVPASRSTVEASSTSPSTERADLSPSVGIGGVTSRDGGTLIRKDDPAVEAAKESKVSSPSVKKGAQALLNGFRSGEVSNIIDKKEAAEQNSPSLASLGTPQPEGSNWRSPREEDSEEKPAAKRSVVVATPTPAELAQRTRVDDDCEKEWSRFTGLAEKFDKVNERLVTNVQATNDRASTSEARQQPQMRQTHHQILELQAEVRKLQAPFDELQARGQRDRDNQLAISQLQMELQNLKETVTANKSAPPHSSSSPQHEASIPAVAESISAFEPSDDASKALLSSFTTDVQPQIGRLQTASGYASFADTVDTNRLLAPKVEEMQLSTAQQGYTAEVPMAHQASIAEVDFMNSAANLGYRRDGRDEELQQLLNDVYDKICVCSERLKEQKAASKAAINGLEGFVVPESLLNEADGVKQDTWEEIEWLRRALVGMHQHLMSAQERTRALERQCQEYEAHVQNIGQMGDSALLSSSFQSALSQATADFPPPMDSIMMPREMSPAPDPTLHPESEEFGSSSLPPTALLLKAPPIVRPPPNSHPAQTASSAATRELSPTPLSSSLRHGNTVATGMAMRGIQPMQDLDATTSFVYEPYLNVPSSAAWRMPMVAATPPVDGSSISGTAFNAMASSPRSVLAPAAVSTGSTAEVYPSGVASVGAPIRPMTMMAAYTSGSSSVGVPGRHIPASSSRPPSMSPARQPRPMSVGPSPGHLQGTMQRIPVAASPQVAQVGFGTALFNRIDTNKDGVIDRRELRAAVKAGALEAGSGALRHVMEKPVTPRTPATAAWQTGYPSAMQYFAPLQAGPGRSASRERTVM